MTISSEFFARIRRLYYAEHWKVGTIAEALGVHHDTVRKAIEADRFVRTGPPPRPSMLDPYKPLIHETLQAYPRLRATRLHEMVRARGYAGGVVQVRRYVARVRPRSPAEAYLRLHTLPGEQAQVDWANFGRIQVGHTQRTLCCFVLVLSWSRALYARFFFDQTLESFLRGHCLAFSALGGVARTLLYDNLKSVVLERIGDHIRFHPRILELAGHYHFAPKPCAPYRGNEKGKVERQIQYLRHSFFAARAFRDLGDLNDQLTQWIREVAHARALPAEPFGRTIQQALDEERPRLLPLPEHPFPCDLVRAAASGKSPYLRFDHNDYSIPHTLAGTPLTLVAGERLVRILHGTQEVARHERSYDRGQTLEDPSHIQALAEEKRKAHELTGRDLLRSTLKNADAFIDTLAQRGEALLGHTRRLLKLLDRYGPQELDQALAEALSRGAVSSASVAHILDQRARQKNAPPPLEPLLPNDPRARALRLTPHALEPYDQLGQPQEPIKKEETP